jgi:hypothetical protein
MSDHEPIRVYITEEQWHEYLDIIKPDEEEDVWESDDIEFIDDSEEEEIDDEEEYDPSDEPASEEDTDWSDNSEVFIE